MVIWQGFGIIIPFVVVLMTQGFIFVAEKLSGPGAYDANPLWPSVDLGLTAILITALGMYLRRRGARVVIDKETGQELVLRSKHSLFFVPMEYWGGILLVGGIAFKLSQ